MKFHSPFSVKQNLPSLFDLIITVIIGLKKQGGHLTWILKIRHNQLAKPGTLNIFACKMVYFRLEMRYTFFLLFKSFLL